MSKLDKAITALECCRDDVDCDACPYMGINDCDSDDLIDDLLSLLNNYRDLKNLMT